MVETMNKPASTPKATVTVRRPRFRPHSRVVSMVSGASVFIDGVIESAKARLATGGFLAGGLGQLIAISSLAGFSREHERDADRMGFDRMVKAGYDPAAGQEIWDRVAKELEERKIKEPPYFFADHPKVLEREKNMAAFASQVPAGGERGREHYLEMTGHARLDALDAVWKRNDGKLLVAQIVEATQ